MLMASQPRPFDQLLGQVMAFDLGDVKASYTNRYGLSAEQADLHERELKRYLALCIANPDACYGMFSDVDNLWHEFICHTPKYQMFCESIAGFYLHHVPTSSDAAKANISDGPSPRQQTTADYERHFGLMDPALWRVYDPMRADDCCSLCTSDKKRLVLSATAN